jgi:glycosyltransferase involved in cell wall biosynthesis
MRIVCRSYDLADSAGSGAGMRALADGLRAHGDEVLATAEAMDLAAIEAWQPDLVIAHQWATREGSRWATALRKPFVMLVHGARQYEQFMPQCDLVLFDTADLLMLAQPQLGRTPARVLCAGDAAHFADIRAALADVAVAGRRRPTLTLCMTVANEGATLEQAIDSVASVVDEIIIGVDARSTDGTLAIAERRATRCFVFEETRPPDFRRMRNRAMALVDTDWAIVLDGHEWIEHADRIPGALETEAWSIEIQTLFEPDERRVPGLAFPFPRIHRRHVRFAGAPAHEEVNTPMERRVLRADIHVWHERKAGVAATTRQAEKSGDELATLRSAWTESGDRRALFYLANGLRESQRFDEAVAAYETYLEAPNFAEEGWQARLYLARCHAGRRDWPAARRQFESAVAEAPERAEAAVGLGHTLMAAGDNGRAAAWFRMAAALPQPTTCRLFVEVPVYRWGAWHGLSLALGALGDAAGAAEADARAVAGGRQEISGILR